MVFFPPFLHFSSHSPFPAGKHRITSWELNGKFLSKLPSVISAKQTYSIGVVMQGTANILPRIILSIAFFVFDFVKKGNKTHSYIFLFVQMAGETYRTTKKSEKKTGLHINRVVSWQSEWITHFQNIPNYYTAEHSKTFFYPSLQLCFNLSFSLFFPPILFFLYSSDTSDMTLL